MEKAQKRREKQRVLLIAGPTASGKSALALELVQALGGRIVNADSMQVYRELAVITARPSPDEMALVPHHLYGHRSASMPCSAAEWRDDVANFVQTFRRPSADQVPTTTDQPLIFVGGTGLYFRVLLEGLSPVPPVDEAVRKQVRARMAELGPQALHRELDLQMAEQLSPTDSQRISRALEVLLSTGQSLAHWQALPPEGGLVDHDVPRVVLQPDREWLERRIRERADIMLGEEGLEEVRQLHALRLSGELPAMRAIGVSVLGSYLDGQATRAETHEALSVQTRRYAKRQETWFRGQMPDWPRLDPSAQSLRQLVDHILMEFL